MEAGEEPILRIENLRKSYGALEVLKGVSFHAEPGETIALVGATGSGKSTIVSLLLRFYDVTGGAVRVDGHDVRSFVPTEFRDGFGIVLQDTFLFTGTIAENVAFFDPSMPREAVERACRDVGLGPLLDRLPNGLDTRLTERGGGVDGEARCGDATPREAVGRRDRSRASSRGRSRSRSSASSRGTPSPSAPRGRAW